MTNKLLLDTCATIWLSEDAPLSDQAIDAIDQASDRGEAVYVSPITAWEIGLLVAKGRLSSITHPAAWFKRLMSLDQIRLAPMMPDILVAASFLPGQPHNDPADRIIMATAREQGLTIVTRDRLILNYAEAGHVLALAC